MREHLLSISSVVLLTSFMDTSCSPSICRHPIREGTNCLRSRITNTQSYTIYSRAISKMSRYNQKVYKSYQKLILRVISLIRVSMSNVTHTHTYTHCVRTNACVVYRSHHHVVRHFLSHYMQWNCNVLLSCFVTYIHISMETTCGLLCIAPFIHKYYYSIIIIVIII